MVDLGSRSQGADHAASPSSWTSAAGRSPRPAGASSATSPSAGCGRACCSSRRSDDVLVRRFESVRRAHPLQGDGRLVDGIAAERALLDGLRDEADLVLDTSDRSVHQLRRAIEQAFAGADETGRRPLRATRASLRVQVRPAGRRRPRGRRPLPAQPVLDPRAARAHRRDDAGPRLRARASRAPRSSSTATPTSCDIIGAGYDREGKRYLTLAVGCTGGKHRSVVDGRGARRPAARPRRPRDASSTGTSAVSEPRASGPRGRSRSAAGTGCTPRCPRCGC